MLEDFDLSTLNHGGVTMADTNNGQSRELNLVRKVFFHQVHGLLIHQGSAAPVNIGRALQDSDILPVGASLLISTEIVAGQMPRAGILITLEKAGQGLAYPLINDPPNIDIIKIPDLLKDMLLPDPSEPEEIAASHGLALPDVQQPKELAKDCPPEELIKYAPWFGDFESTPLFLSSTTFRRKMPPNRTGLVIGVLEQSESSCDDDDADLWQRDAEEKDVEYRVNTDQEHEARLLEYSQRLLVVLNFRMLPDRKDAVCTWSDPNKKPAH